MALGAGSIPEEVFGMCRRRDCETVKMLRHRALKDVLKLGALASPSELLTAVERAVRRIGYAADVRSAVVEEYAELISLDVPLNKYAAALLGGRPGMTLEELVYSSRDPLVDALHIAAAALYMEYADGGDVERLDTAEFATYTVLTMLQRGQILRSRAAKLISLITDQVLEASA